MTLSEVGKKIERVGSLRWKAVRIATDKKNEGKFKEGFYFSGKVAKFQKMLDELYDLRLPLLSENMKKHRESEVGQFLKNTNGMHGQDILMTKDKLFSLTNPVENKPFAYPLNLEVTYKLVK